MTILEFTTQQQKSCKKLFKMTFEEKEKKNEINPVTVGRKCKTHYEFNFIDID